MLCFIGSLISDVHTANGPLSSEPSKNAIDGRIDTIGHTLPADGSSLQWFKVFFKTRVQITSFEIKSRADSCCFTRINDMRVYTIFNTVSFYGNESTSEKRFLVNTDSLPTITEPNHHRKTYTIPDHIDGVPADELLLKRDETIDFSEIIVNGY